MKASFISLLLVVRISIAGAPEWSERIGTFAAFRAPASMRLNQNKRGGDTIMEVFESREISLIFDSEAPTLPPTLQKQLERTVEAWAGQRKSDWSKRAFIENGGGFQGFVGEKNPEGMPFYLHLGFGVEEGMTFAIHIYFRSLDDLGDVEHILKSMKLKSPKNYRPLTAPRDPIKIPGLHPIPERK